MGTSLHAAPLARPLYALGRGASVSSCSACSCSSSSSCSGRTESVYWISVAETGPAIFGIGRRSGLGPVHCPRSLGTSSVFGGRCGRRRYAAEKVLENSLPLPPRSRKCCAQLPTHNDSDNDKQDQPEISASSFNGTVFPSVIEAEDGDSGGQVQERPRIPYRLITGLASIGFIETVYLTWAKFSGTTVTCPIGGNCTSVLDSDYATVFGVPLAFIGMVAYGAIALLGSIQLLATSLDGEEEELIRWIFLGSTTSMSVASMYFMYILTTKLEGASCTYCVSSAVISISLLLATLRGFSSKDVRKMAGLQLAVAASVVVGLTVAFGEANAAFARAQDLDLPPVEPEVVTASSVQGISLAKHLQSVGARMYGAFWCSHCYEQKQMFGREAMKYVDYVECYPEGYRKGVQIAKACDAANIQGFPTWIINGQTLSGEQELEDLAKASGYDTAKLKQFSP